MKQKIKNRKVSIVIRYLVGVVSALLLFAGVAVGHEVDVKNGATIKPSIRFSETKFDFGTVKEGDIVSHDFEFVNDGKGVLKIKDLIPA
jgi:hypothetical protein